jgi:hypothetical protein
MLTNKSNPIIIKNKSFSIYEAICLPPILNNAEHSQLVAVLNTKLTAPILLDCSSSLILTRIGHICRAVTNMHMSAPILVF